MADRYRDAAFAAMTPQQSVANDGIQPPLWRLPAGAAEDLDRFGVEVDRYRRGLISAAEFRAFRVPQGVYEQRQDDVYMIRIRAPGGILLAHQMRALARASLEYGSCSVHVTTRQGYQIHGVLLEDLHPALLAMAKVGLSCKGGGGNTVRGITTCPDAGVCPSEQFDVTPYAIALTEELLDDPRSFQLPRKYKIAFSGCNRDCSGARVNDLGLIATRREGEDGFVVYVGGGMGARSRMGDLLEEFVPATEVHLVAEAIKRVFDRHGNRRDRHRARIRFLIQAIGLRRFRELYLEDLARLRSEGRPRLQPRPLPDRPTPCSKPPNAVAGDGVAGWRRVNADQQKQPDYTIVRVPLELGDIDADALTALASIAEDLADGSVRADECQNLGLRWVLESRLPEVYRRLRSLGLADSSSPTIGRTAACAGAESCKLGICRSRGLSVAIAESLAASGLELDEARTLSIRVSGCPDSCSRNPSASIGLVGAARRVAGRLVPHYLVQLGGRTAGHDATLARGRIAIPAHYVPSFIVELLSHFRHSRAYPLFDEYLRSGGFVTAERLLQQRLPDAQTGQEPLLYVDWGAEEEFSLAGRGPGECGAGVFDLIEVDLESARESLGRGDRASAVELAARALLVTRGQESRTEIESLDLFSELFIDSGLISESHRETTEAVRRHVVGESGELDVSAQQVSRFVTAVQRLYENMDDSLRFPEDAAADTPAEPSASPIERSPTLNIRIDREADLHAVTCPLNFVKTKMILDRMQPGQVLSVLLGEEGCRNVPESAEREGHEVLQVARHDELWRVLLRKSGAPVPGDPEA